MRKLLIIMLSMIACCYTADAQKKAHFDSVLDLSYSFSTNDNKYSSLGLGYTAGVQLLNDWLFLGGGAKVGYDKYEFPLLSGKYFQGTMYLDARLYIPVKNLTSLYVDYKLGVSGADPKISSETSSEITTYKNLILGGPFKSLGFGIRIPSEDGKDVGLGFSFDYNELTLKKNREPILGAGLVENLALKLEYYF